MVFLLIFNNSVCVYCVPQSNPPPLPSLVPSPPLLLMTFLFPDLGRMQVASYAVCVHDCNGHVSPRSQHSSLSLSNSSLPTPPHPPRQCALDFEEGHKDVTCVVARPKRSQRLPIQYNARHCHYSWLPTRITG